MSGWDQGQVRFADQNLAAAEAPNSYVSIAKEFREFIRMFRYDNMYTYREQLLRHFNMRDYYIEVAMDDLKSYDAELAEKLEQRPGDMLPLFEQACKDALKFLNAVDPGTRDEDIPAIQVTLTSSANTSNIRQLHASNVSRLVQIPGIIISSSRPKAKATHVTATCRTCRHTIANIPLKPGFSGVSLPRSCQNVEADVNRTAGVKDCGIDPYDIVPSRSSFVDQQTLKLQENPEDVPTGEMPRNVILSVDRRLVNRVVPGCRVTVLGVFSIYNSQRNSVGGVAIKNPYIRVVGLRTQDGQDRHNLQFDPEEEIEFMNLAKTNDVYNQKIVPSIAPSIMGMDDVKRAVACLLFGGSRKLLPDGARLRGDINVLLLGDPSTAKSQVLKFVEKTAPISIYTSGKGSSAAGLTASVVRDTGSGEFYLEGGAMVLADGGVVCIDEFDKMRSQDRVAIHEAMEQQTISVAKAGITTILNSRTSVLAAANPTFGSYDDNKDTDDQVDLMATILSRFDTIFVIRDERNEDRDRAIAKHIMGVHKQAVATDQNNGADLSVDFLKRYIAYCRSKVFPRLSQEAADKLQNSYISIRQDVRKRADQTGTMAAIPITVRQLEAVVRLSEALARMQLSSVATSEHVEEALRLFRVSTYNAASNGVPVEGISGGDQAAKIDAVEKLFKKRYATGARHKLSEVINRFTSEGYEEATVRRAVDIMGARQELQYMREKQFVRRIR